MRDVDVAVPEGELRYRFVCLRRIRIELDDKFRSGDIRRINRTVCCCAIETVAKLEECGLCCQGEVLARIIFTTEDNGRGIIVREEKHRESGSTTDGTACFRGINMKFSTRIKARGPVLYRNRI